MVWQYGEAAELLAACMLLPAIGSQLLTTGPLNFDA